MSAEIQNERVPRGNLPSGQCLRAVGFRCNLLDPGDVHALRRSDSDLQRPAARRSRPSRAINRETATPVLVNPKSEARNPKQTETLKSELRNSTLVPRHSNLPET
jgi:hypothetical protein